MTYLPVDILIDQKTKQRHRIDSLNLLAYVALLVLVLVTTWFFKRRTNKSHLHETGLAIIYGLIMGAGLRYFGLEVTISSISLEDKLPRTAPADYVTILAHNLGEKINRTHVYAYEFRGEILQNAKLGSQISYASVEPEVFFNIILPPIILNAGLSLKRRHFFRNIGAIFSYAFLGTTISVATVGSILYGFIHAVKYVFQDSYLADQFTLANCLYFGAIISPTDPLAALAIFQELQVDVNLFALVFGESILNDAVSIVLTHSIDDFSVIYGRDPNYSIWRVMWECLFSFLHTFLASCSIGVVFGVITAITTKFTKLTESPLLESSLVVLMSYSSFLTAEVVDTSGIVAILMCGITQAHYTINNLSFDARERLKTLFEMLTFLCENFLFLAVGVSLWQRGQAWSPSFIGMTFVAIIVARALSVYPLTVLLNLGRKHKIPMNYQHLITWGGAARGVISYSLAARNTIGEARRIMLSTTSAVVIVTVIAVGAAVGPLLKCLKIPYGASEKQQHGSSEGERALAGDNDDEGIDEFDQEREEAVYHATNNPAWLVRPKRLHSRRWPSGSSCRPRCDRYDSLLAVGGDSSTATLSICCSKATTAGRSYNYGRRYHHQRCGQMSIDTTPVLEIEAAPVTLAGSGRMAPHRQTANGKRCCCDCAIDSRTASYSSANQDMGGGQLISATAGALTQTIVTEEECDSQLGKHQQQLQIGVISEIDGAMNNRDDRTSSTLALALDAAANLTCGQEIALPGDPAAKTAYDRNSCEGANIDGPYENASLVRGWRFIDNHFIKPLLTNSQPTLLETMPTSLGALARLFTSEEQLMRRKS